MQRIYFLYLLYFSWQNDLILSLEVDPLVVVAVASDPYYQWKTESNQFQTFVVFLFSMNGMSIKIFSKA